MGFRTQYGHYEFPVMPFGLTTTLATFMNLANLVFKDIFDQFVVVFIDDVLIYSKSREEHEEHLKLVLTRLQEEKLYTKFKKCEFQLGQVSFLGHIVNKDGILINAKKIKTIVEWPILKVFQSLKASWD